MTDELEEIPVKEEKEDGSVVINIAADAANADWIRAARKLREGKDEEVEKMSKKKMYREKNKK